MGDATCHTYTSGLFTGSTNEFVRNRTEHLYDLLKDFDRAMLITHSDEGHMHARLMAVAELKADADAGAYFATRIESPKVTEISANPNVTLTFQASQRFASL